MREDLISRNLGMNSKGKSFVIHEDGGATSIATLLDTIAYTSPYEEYAWIMVKGEKEPRTILQQKIGQELG